MTACLDTFPTRVRARRRLYLCMGVAAAGLALAGAGPVRAQSASSPAASSPLRAHPAVFELGNHGELHLLAVIGAEHRGYGLPGAADLQAPRREVREGARAIEAATGRAPVWFRGATAHYDEQALQELAQLGVRIAGFSLNADAGGTLAAAEVAARLGRARDGDVILAHLNRPGSGTRAGLEQALPLLRRMGFTFVHLGTRTLVEVGVRAA